MSDDDRSIRILLVEDRPDDEEFLAFALRKEGLIPNIERVETGEELRACLARGPWDIVISDNTLPSFSGAEALAITRLADPVVPFIIVSGTVGDLGARAAMARGANDYVPKGNLARLGQAIAKHCKKGTRRGRVLVIDDEPIIARALARTLSGEHDVVVATSGEQAVAGITKGERFDVIFCDMSMPGLSGMDVHARLLLVAPDQAARMIFCTGGAGNEEAALFLRGVASRAIEKPFDTSVIKALVRDRLR